MYTKSKTLDSKKRLSQLKVWKSWTCRVQILTIGDLKTKPIVTLRSGTKSLDMSEAEEINLTFIVHNYFQLKLLVPFQDQVGKETKAALSPTPPKHFVMPMALSDATINV